LITCDAKLKNFAYPAKISRVFADYPNNEIDSSEVQYLQMVYEPIDFVPKGLEKFFPFLLGLRISNGRIKKLSKYDLKPFNELELLSFDGNQIEVLDSDLFDFTPKLKWIYFDHNRIAKIGQETFNSLRNLRHVNLELNSCISFEAENRRQIQEMKNKISKHCLMKRINSKFFHWSQ
jgi:Leucine-rich repeat (LRR) protein